MYSFASYALTALTLISTASAWTTTKSFTAQGAAIKAAGDPLGGSGNYIIKNVQTGLVLSFYRANGVTNFSPVAKGTPVQIQLNNTMGNQLRIGNGVKCASAQWNVYNDSITPAHDWAMVSYACKVGTGNLTGTATLEPTKQWWYAVPYDTPIVPVIGNISPPAVKSTAKSTSLIANATSTAIGGTSSSLNLADASASITRTALTSTLTKVALSASKSTAKSTSSKKSTTTTTKKTTTPVKTSKTSTKPSSSSTSTTTPAVVTTSVAAQAAAVLPQSCTATSQCRAKIPSNSHQKCSKNKCTFGCNTGYKQSATGTSCVKLATKKRSYTPRGPELEARFARKVVDLSPPPPPAPVPMVKRDESQAFYIIPLDHVGDMVAQAVTPMSLLTWGGYTSAALMPWSKNDPSQLWVFIQQP